MTTVDKAVTKCQDVGSIKSTEQEGYAVAKMLVLGIRAQSGVTSQEKGAKAYAMRPEIIIATAIEKVANATLTVQAAGYEGTRIECTEEVFSTVSGNGSKLPVVADVNLGVRAGRMGPTPVCLSVSF